MRIVRYGFQPPWPFDSATKYEVGTIVENDGQYFQVETSSGYGRDDNYWEHLSDYVE